MKKASVGVGILQDWRDNSFTVVHCVAVMATSIVGQVRLVHYVHSVRLVRLHDEQTENRMGFRFPFPVWNDSMYIYIDIDT